MQQLPNVCIFNFIVNTCSLCDRLILQTSYKCVVSSVKNVPITTVFASDLNILDKAHTTLSCNSLSFYML